MDRDTEKKKKKKKQEESVVSVKRPVARQAPPVYTPPPRKIPPPRRVPTIPTTYNLDKQKMQMMRQKIRSQNLVRDAQIERQKQMAMDQANRRRMMMERNNEIQRQQAMLQQKRQVEQRQMANARIAQMNEHNVRVTGGAKRP